MTTFSGEASTDTAHFTIATDALQWRVRWRCDSGTLQVSSTPPPRRGDPIVESACPGDGEGFAIHTGQIALQIEAVGPWEATVEQQIDTPLDERPVPGMESAPVLAQGQFYEIENPGSGTAVIYALADGRRILRLEDFETVTTTDLFVWLSEAVDPQTSEDAASAEYVNVADAVVAMWHWKYVYDRPPPEGVERISDPGPDPSYPSEHAAIAAAASAVLAYLFPERPALRLQEMADEAADSRVFAGANTRSDVEAGLELGRQVGEAVITYAEADGAGDECTVVPPGPAPRYWAPPPGSVANPVQPCAGTWEPWVLESGDQFRPGPPPAFGSPEFRAQAEEAVRVKENLTEDQKRLATFWAGGEAPRCRPGSGTR